MTTTLDSAKKAANLTLSGGDLTATAAATDANGLMALATTSHAAGLYYFEMTTVTRTGSASSVGVGLANASQSFANSHYLGEGNDSIGMYGGGGWYIGGVAQPGTTIEFFLDGSHVGVAINITTKKVWFTSDGTTWNGDIITNQNPVGAVGGFDISAVTGAVFAGVYADVINNVVTLNLGATAYTFTQPTGYSVWDDAATTYAAFSVPQLDGRVTTRMVGY